MKEYLATLDDATFGAASAVTPKFVSPSDPAAQWTGAMRGPAFFAYADNYLIDVKFGVIMDVEASRAIRQAEVGAAKRMIERTEERFGIKPERLAADTAYGSAPTLHWLVNEKQIAPHIPVIDKSKRDDGTFSREEFTFDKERDIYTCPAGKALTTTGTIVNDEQLLYRASKRDCGVCPFKMRCCPKEPARKIPRSIYEEARDIARALAKTEAFEQSRHDRKRVEMLFAHLKRILKLGRLRLRGPRSAQDEFTLRRMTSRPPTEAMRLSINSAFGSIRRRSAIIDRVMSSLWDARTPRNLEASGVSAICRAQKARFAPCWLFQMMPKTVFRSADLTTCQRVSS